MDVIPEVPIKTIKAEILAGDGSRKIAQDLGVLKSYVNKVRNLMPAEAPRPQSGAPLKLTAQICNQFDQERPSEDSSGGHQNCE